MKKGQKGQRKLTFALASDPTKEVEVLVDAEFGTREEFIDELEERQDSAFERRAKNLRKNLLTDAEFRAEAEEAWGLKNTKGKKGDDTAAQVEEWKAVHVTPLETKLGEATKTIESMRRKVLVGEITNAARAAGIAEHLLAPVGRKKEPAIVAMVEDDFRYDPETDRHYEAKGADRFAMALDPSDENPYAGPSDYFAKLANKPEAKGLFSKQPQRGAGHAGDTSNTGAKKTIDAGDNKAFLENLDKIASGEVAVKMAE